MQEGLNLVGHRAFINCRSLRSITVPDSLFEFGSLALGFWVDYPTDYREQEHCYPDSEFVILGSRKSVAESYAKVYEFKFKPVNRKKRSTNHGII